MAPGSAARPFSPTAQSFQHDVPGQNLTYSAALWRLLIAILSRRIISFSSSVVGIFNPTYGVYAAAKAAVEAMTHVLLKELGDRKINVNAIAPGPIETGLFLDDKTDEQIAQVTKLIPFGRLGKPQDIADVVSFLAGPDSHWVTGQVLRANGGMI